MLAQNNSFVSNMAQPKGQQAPAGGSKFASYMDANKPWEYDFTAMNPNAAANGNKQTAPGAEYSMANGHEGADFVGWGYKGYGHYAGHGAADNMNRAQQYYTDQFKQNMPHLNDLLTNRLAGDVTNSMNQGLNNSRLQDSRRGLLFGGIHEGNEGQIRGNAAGQMAQGKSDINSQLQNTYEGMANNTIKAGVDFQQQQQQIQNSIYQNALANMMNQQKAFSSLGGAAGMAAGLYFTGGNPAGGMVGAQAGSQVL